MLKRIPKSDISIRPFKAYKEWSFISGSSEISILEAQYGNYNSVDSNVILTGSLSGSSFNKHSLYGQLRAQFYNGNEDNPFIRFGTKKNNYNVDNASRDRFLSGSAKVISIPQIYVGEGIKKGSFRLINNNTRTFTDDSYGNLTDLGGDTVDVISVDVYDNQIIFTDLIGNPYTASFQTAVGDFDILNETFNLIYDGTSYDMNIISFDIETGKLLVDNIPFLDAAAGVNKIGNIFYNQGLIVLTRDSNAFLNSNWEISYKSTQTIYEHEYLLIVNEDEFNVSQNPTAIVEVGRETSFIIDSDNKTRKVTTNPGAKYIRKKSILDNGTTIDYRIPSQYTSSVSGGFGEAEYSSSIDSTGSYLLPFITTIGLYDDNCDLVAVAKLPQPIKSEHDIPVNFIVRFDT